MSLRHQLAAVRLAQQRATAARGALDGVTTALLTRSAEHPLTTVGVAASAGVVLGSLHLRALRVPGLGPLLSGGLGGTLAFVMRLFTEFGLGGLGDKEGAVTGRPAETASAPVDTTAS